MSVGKKHTAEQINDKLRDEFLAREQFYTLFETKYTHRALAALAQNDQATQLAWLPTIGTRGDPSTFFLPGYAYRKERGWYQCGPNYTLEVGVTR